MHVLLMQRREDIMIKQEKSLAIINRLVVVEDVGALDNLNLKKESTLMRSLICSLVVVFLNHKLGKEDNSNSINILNSVNNNDKEVKKIKLQYSSLWVNSFQLSSLYLCQCYQILGKMVLVETQCKIIWVLHNTDFHSNKPTTIHTNKFHSVFIKYIMLAKQQYFNLTIIKGIK